MQEIFDIMETYEDDNINLLKQIEIDELEIHEFR